MCWRHHHEAQRLIQHMFSWHVRFRDSNDDLTAVPLFVYVGSLFFCALILFSVRFLSYDRNNGHRQPQTTFSHWCFTGRECPSSLTLTYQISGKTLIGPVWIMCPPPKPITTALKIDYSHWPTPFTYPHLVGGGDGTRTETLPGPQREGE